MSDEQPQLGEGAVLRIQSWDEIHGLDPVLRVCRNHNQDTIRAKTLSGNQFHRLDRKMVEIGLESGDVEVLANE